MRATEARRFEGQRRRGAHVVEVLAAVPPQGPPHGVSATNVYELTDGGWRMVLHHATPMTEPEQRERTREEETPPPSRTLH